jgi:tripartite-type tricarboxylate transporter receptor subunit TctC
MALADERQIEMKLREETRLVSLLSILRASVNARVLILAACVAILPLSGWAQPAPVGSGNWPQRPVKIVVPYPPAGNTDIIARLVAQPLSQALGQQFLVENRPGANGTIAVEAVARSPADGYTLLVSAVAQLAIVPALMKTRYDPVADFVPVSIIATNPLVLTVNANFPAKTLREFVDYARSRNGTLQYASSGDGGVPHLTSVLFYNRAGLQMVHVPYKGSGQVLNDILGGHVPVYFANLSEVLPHASKGTFRLLAQTGDTRAPQLPDVPTVAEQGYAGFRSLTWNGLLAPAGTPKPIVDRLAELVIAATRNATIAGRMTAIGVIPVGNTPQQFAETLRTDIATWSEAVRVAGVKLD